MESTNLMQMLNSLAPILIITFIFIFLIFRPQYKKANEHKKLLASLQNNDEIITSSGSIGKITNIDGEIVTLEVSNGVMVQIVKQSILEKFDREKMNKPKEIKK